MVPEQVCKQPPYTEHGRRNAFPLNQAVLTAACEPDMAAGAVVVMPR